MQRENLQHESIVKVYSVKASDRPGN